VPEGVGEREPEIEGKGGKGRRKTAFLKRHHLMLALLPLLLALSAAGWLIAFWRLPYTRLTDLNGWGCGLLAMLSLGEVVPEECAVAFIVPYFVLDSAACVRERDWLYVGHHVASLSLIALGFDEPNIGIEQRGISRVLLVEWSVLLLSHWNRDRSSRLRYALLVIGYFLNRVVYLGYLAYFSEFQAVGLTGTSHEVLGVWGTRALHLMMTVWFFMLLRKAPRYHWNCFTLAPQTPAASQKGTDLAALEDAVPLVSPSGAR